jgi:hypothetical protein
MQVKVLLKIITTEEKKVLCNRSIEYPKCNKKNAVRCTIYTDVCCVINGCVVFGETK